MTATEAAARMLTHPDDFFKSYPVMMAGGTGAWVPNTANVMMYRLSKKDPGMAGAAPDQKVGHFGATRKGLFGQTLNISSFKMDEQVLPNCSGPLTTHGVPMVNYNSAKDGKVNLLGDVTAMDHYVVDAGANYMTTGLLTGCCFAWTANGGGLWCSHVRPDGIDSVMLQTTMATHGRFAAAPHTPLATFGRPDYAGAPYAIVIGVKHSGTWQLYAQTSTNQFKTINGAWRIHPGAVARL